MIADIYVKKFQDAGFEVVNVITGKEVLRVASQAHFDLILLDMVLPEMNGMDVLKELRSGDYDQSTKIVIFSNLNKFENEPEALKNGADGFISKSEFNPSQLVEAIRKFI